MQNHFTRYFLFGLYFNQRLEVSELSKSGGSPFSTSRLCLSLETYCSPKSPPSRPPLTRLFLAPPLGGKQYVWRKNEAEESKPTKSLLLNKQRIGGHIKYTSSGWQEFIRGQTRMLRAALFCLLDVSSLGKKQHDMMSQSPVGNIFMPNRLLMADRKTNLIIFTATSYLGI